jgi:hypothetical protein
MSQNWLFYTTLADFPSQNAPTDSAEEAESLPPFVVSVIEGTARRTGGDPGFLEKSVIAGR